MAGKSNTSVLKSVLFILVIIFSLISSYGQQIPDYPVSFRVFSPLVLNPAIAGSKDFTSIDFISGWLGKSSSQILSLNSRLITSSPGYVMLPTIRKFSSFGIGGYLFNEKKSPAQNMGFSAIGSYQIPLDEKSVYYLSFGVAVKGIYNIMDSINSPDPGLRTPEKRLFYPNLDLGLYFYGPKLFAGMSAIDLLGNPEDPDSTGVFRLPVARHFYFITGYKFILSEAYDIVLEPSLIFNKNRYRNQKMSDILRPLVKLYMQGFCLGTYFNNYDNVSFFFQYKFPKFYLGTFFEIPRNSPYFIKPLNVEFTLGINYSTIKPGTRKTYNW